LRRLEKFTKDGSGWKLKRCELLDLKIAPYQPFRGRSYIKTPAYIPPRTVINVKNQDNRCFERAILSALYPVDSNNHNPGRTTNYQTHLGELNFTGISFPVKVTDIPKFEHQNPGLSVNTFGWKGGLYPLHVSKREGRGIDLLLINDRKEPEKTLCLDQEPGPHAVQKQQLRAPQTSMSPLSTHLLHRKAARKPQK